MHVAQIFRCPKCKECITVPSKERFEAINESTEVDTGEVEKAIEPIRKNGPPTKDRITEPSEYKAAPLQHSNLFAHLIGKVIRKKETCNFCKAVLEASQTLCPHCGIEKSKTKEDLTEPEADILSAAWLIRIVGILFIIGGIVFIGLATLGHIFAYILGLFLFVFGLAMRRYKLWAFYVAVIINIAIINYMILLLTAGITSGKIIIISFVVLIFSAFFCCSFLSTSSRKIFFRAFERNGYARSQIKIGMWTASAMAVIISCDGQDCRGAFRHGGSSSQ